MIYGICQSNDNDNSSYNYDDNNDNYDNIVYLYCTF
jgi:hypothetical protein